jgi:hypothetical protein
MAASSPGSAPRLLAIYLKDHHAGAVAGASLAHRAAGANEGTPYGGELARVADEIDQDKETLERLMDALEVQPDQLKDSAAWAGEKLGRLKPNARWRDYSPLSRLLELEGLMLGVTGKLGLWRSLQGVAETIDGLEGFDLPGLEARASDQRSRLEELRLRAAAEALAQD